MLRDLVHYVIIGHSERRHVFNENLDMIRDKVAASVRNEITPILCIGETKSERQQGEVKMVLHDQLMTALSNLTAAEVGKIVISYEPVWAIGTGDVAKPTQVTAAVEFIRGYVREIFGPKAAKNVRILYGGSVVPEVTAGFLSVPGIDGFLVGGASLNYHDFSGIVDASKRWQRDREGA
jgi:triosephosphate isomerase